MSGPVLMGLEKRKSLAPSGVRTVRPCTTYDLPPLFPLKAEVVAQIAVARGCHNERYTHAGTHAHLFLVFRRVKLRGRVCRQFGVATEQKGDLKSGLFKKKA
jgi:hypothetical protein